MNSTTAAEVAVDTSVAVALLVDTHESHTFVAKWARNKRLALCGHAIAETYSVLTRLPGDVRVGAIDAAHLIDVNFSRMLTLDEDSSATIHRQLAEAGIAGGATYDAMVALTAKRHDLTLATRDGRARSTYEMLGIQVELVVDH